MGSNILSKKPIAKVLDKSIIRVIISLLMTISILDIILLRNTKLLLGGFDTEGVLFFYVIFDVIYLTLQFFLLLFLLKSHLFKSNDIVSRSLKAFVVITQSATSFIIAIALYEILAYSYYHTLLISISVGLSYLSAIVILALLVKKLLGWYVLNKTTKTSLLYAISSSSILVNFVISALFFENISMDWSPVVPTWTGTPFVFIPPGSILEFLYSAQFLTMVISFSLMWYSTFKMLYRFIVKGNRYYLVLVILPLIFFLFQYMTVYNSFLLEYIVSLSAFESNLYVFIFTLSKPIGALLFGIIFIILSRKIPKQFHLHDYLILCCFGLFLLFASNQATILTVFPYPPFGFVSVSTLCLSAYFFYVGIYYSVISISENNELRNLVRTITSKYDLKMLDEISSANIIGEIEKKVIENISNREEPIRPIQIEESEIKKYVEDILNELKN
jgi:hypothetical protein